jgi:diketogulonate reductase-like aldo/keto reductase
MMYAVLMSTRQRTDIHISSIGLGTAQFAGKGWISALTPTIPRERVGAIVKAALDGGITWFDTSEMYGGGTSERALAAGLKDAGVIPGEVTVATKWLPIGRTARNIERTIGTRLDALHPFPIDLHQIHLNRGGFSSVRAQMRAMARLVEAGKIRAIGVSNFTTRQMETAHDELAKHGIPLASNEVQINLLRRNIETNGHARRRPPARHLTVGLLVAARRNLDRQIPRRPQPHRRCAPVATQGHGPDPRRTRPLTTVDRRQHHSRDTPPPRSLEERKTMPTIAIVGAGPGLGLAIAPLFGKNGYDVALIARNKDKLDGLVNDLAAENITAAAFTADVRDRPALTQALHDAAERFGGVDVLEYSPGGTIETTKLVTPSESTPEDVQFEIEFQL